MSSRLPRIVTPILAMLVATACTSAKQTPPTVAPAPAAPDAPAAPSIDVDLDRLRTGLDTYLEGFGAHWGPAFEYSGFVLVARGDEILYQRGLGLADRATGQVPDIDTSFRVGSVTKQFTAAAILKLRQQGKLDVTDPIRKHLPDYPGPGADVTIHQLLTHTGGVWSYTSDPERMETRAEPHSVKQMLEMFWNEPLDFEPGAEFSYSNSGYVVLGAIIEAASGTSYGEYLRRELFEPAGLERTEYGDHEGLANRAQGYERTAMEALEDAHPIHMSVPYAAGGIRSTARDLWKWHQALLRDHILDDESKALLYTVEKSDYAYGWSISSYDEHPLIGHGGGIDGFVCDFERLVDDDVVIVAWTNTGPEADSVSRAVLPLVLGKDGPAPPEEPEPVPFDPAIGAVVDGRYALTEASRTKLRAMGWPDGVIASFETIEMRHDERSLVFDPLSQPEGRMHPKGDGTFFVKEHGMPPSLSIDRPEGSAVAQGIIVRQGLLEVRYTRVEEKPAPKAKAKGRPGGKGR
ncbi:serine hydrolase domain-containing protein [Paraliomyxa miuraensis]|uniref:serine hydrolase domain-containing protein n=1 Tax=Paraliomyxa miuraensis TaxID=376150 RepID=UPI002257B3AD|nr:serine hydrolase domain-containing protein [Paraliomyxa miuraensis]MCX4242680.1 beta-lactamase family protein [Paraliomyxa miuraensis]